MTEPFSFHLLPRFSVVHANHCSSCFISVFNPLYTGGLFHCYILDESICDLGMSGLFCLFYSNFDGKLLANNVDPDQTPHYVASDLGLHCLLMALLWVSRLVGWLLWV